jgi:hypothetical protein
MRPDARSSKQSRRAIAAQAARLIAEDGLTDYAWAKRKAARQLGFRDSEPLPDNREVEDAVRDYQSVFQADEQRERLAALRARAQRIMENLAAFQPMLAGGAWSGVATRGSGVDIDLFCDGDKPVEMHLLNHGFPYRSSERCHFDPAIARRVTVLTTDMEGVEVRLSVFPHVDRRLAGRLDGSGRPQRGGLDEVRRLVAESESDAVERMLAGLSR